MQNLIARACIHPIDYSGVLNNRRLVFKEKIQESANIYSFVFEAEKPCTWQAGQHGIFTMPNKNVEGKNWRAFSVASSPHEGVIRIGTIVQSEASDFKKKLVSLESGEKITMRGPFGEFHSTPKVRRIIGVAGGIGITPFRSIISNLHSNPLVETKITLIYSARDTYTYKSELDNWAKDSRIQIIYTHTTEEVNQTLQNQINIFGNKAHYFISGAPGMIKALRTTLKQRGIKKIINDPFKGY